MKELVDKHAALKPCPFCGNKIAPTVKSIAGLECNDYDDPNEWRKTHYTVVCDYTHDYGCGASIGYYANSPEEAADIWNRRADNDT